MSPISNFFIISATLGLMGGGAVYEVKQERADIEAALLQLHEQEVYLKEYTRSLAYEIEDLKAERYQ